MVSNKNLNGITEYDMFTDTCRFTDDTAMPIATMNAFKTDKNYAKDQNLNLLIGQLFVCVYRCNFIEMYTRYPNAGYGKVFNQWVRILTKSIRKLWQWFCYES